MKRLAVALPLAFAAACGASEPNTASVAAFPADYLDSYVEVRGCRKSADHELDFVRVLADPAALAPYTGRAGTFPDGAVVLKEQYDPSDVTCSGTITQWTVMRKAPAATERLGWDWQQVDPKRRVLEAHADRCSGCHAGCSGAPQVGYDFTCAEP